MVTEEKNLALPITITLFVSEVKVGRMADEERRGLLMHTATEPKGRLMLMKLNMDGKYFSDALASLRPIMETNIIQDCFNSVNNVNNVFSVYDVLNYFEMF